MSDALSRAVEQFRVMTGIAALCPDCGGLTTGSPVAVVTRGPAVRCKGCGLYLDSQGRACGHRGADGVVRVRVIELGSVQ